MHHCSPSCPSTTTGTTSSVAGNPPSTTPTWPEARTRPSAAGSAVTGGPVAIAPATRPAARSAVRSPTPTAAAQIVGSIGPGAIVRPSSSSTTACSANPWPWPPAASGTASPSHPSPASSSQNGGGAGTSRSSAAWASIATRATAGVQRFAVKRRAVSSSARWSSLIAMLI